MADGVTILVQILDTLKFILVWFWWLILLIWILIMKMRLKNWPVEAVIIEKRGNNLVKTNDRAGKYNDEFTGITGYRLQKCKDTIPVLDYDWVLHNINVPNTMLERIVSILRGNIGTIFLFRYGAKQYKPLRIKEKDGVKFSYQPIINEKGEEVVIKVYQPLDPRDKLGVLDFEVVDWDNMNFMVQEQRASIERRKKKGDWIKTIAIPLAIIGASVIFSIIMIKFGYDFASSLKGSAIPTPAPKEPAVSPSIPIISDIMPGQ
jgi:hypothetical protein